MHVVRSNRDHARIGRDLTLLEGREPQLIKLPISMPSIPILGPILTPLIGGTNNKAATTPTPTTNPPNQTTPPSSPTTTPPPTTTPSDGSEDGNDDEGESNGNPSNGDTTDAGNATSANGSISGMASETSAGSSPEPSESGSTTGTSSSNDSNGGDSSSSTADSSQGLNVPVANAGGSVNSNTGTGAGSDSGNGSDTSGNLNGIPSPQTTLSSGNGLPGSTSVSGPDSSSTGSSNARNNSGSLSGGAIAGIVVVLVLILLAVAIILFRKRYIHRRTERRHQWWARAGSHTLSGRDSPDSPVRSNGGASARSSFATTFDHAQSPRLSMSFGDVPPLPPPMAELRGGPHTNFQLFSPNSAIADSPVLITFDNSQAPVVASRTSVHSVASNGSGAQYLEVPGSNANGQEVTTPMSVRPFSPSESFSFPKPPKKQSGDWNSASQRPMSSNTFYSATQSATDHTPTVPANPFDDPAQPQAAFADVESIRRPFVSTRFDELSVSVGDSVKIIKLFDDGWALVQKLPSLEELIQKDRDTPVVQGLIPIDCFRAEGQDLSSFFSENQVANALYQKRSSSADYTLSAE